MPIKIIDKLRVKFNDWFIGFIVKNEEKIMESEMKEYHKKKKEESKSLLEIPEIVAYPHLEFINEGVYYKKIKHPVRPKVYVYLSSYLIWPIQSILQTSSFDTPAQITDKMNSFIKLLEKIDADNNLSPCKYFWTKAGETIEFSFQTSSNKKGE